MKSKAPIARKEAHEITTNGHTRTDHYFWMNQRDNAEVLAYINAENAYANTYFEDTQELQEKILQEFEKNIDPNDKGAPFLMEGNWYQRENLADKDYPMFYRLEGEQKFLFLDENERAKGHSYYNLASWLPSPNNELLALAEDTVGRRQYKITFRNNTTNEFLKDALENTDGSVVWANDNEHVFYVKKDPETLREFQVYRHKIGSPVSQDKLVFEELDERFYVFIAKTKDNRYIQINLYSSTRSETYFIDANTPEQHPEVFFEKEKDHLYEVESFGTGFLVLSNKDALNNELRYFAQHPSKGNNYEIILTHKQEVLLEEFSVFKDYVVVVSRENGLRSLNIIHWKDKSSHKIALNEECYSIALFVNEDFNSDVLYYSYNSMTTPPSVIAYNMRTHQENIHFVKALPNPDFKSEDYSSHRTWALANDGTKIPISLVYKKDLDFAKAPLLLYAYGSYGITIPTTFSAYRLSLLERGFVFAIAHIRGGKYMGEKWYQDGKWLKKKNTFTDFINCAEHLKRNNFCKPDGLYAQGGSAGGMLMGGIANMAPYLFKGIIAQVPFVDVVTTMLDESIPLTVGEFEEWGNPKEEDYYQYMLSYSPYDNVQAMHYPSMFVSTGYHDSQVQYWEPLKWIAKLRELKQDDNTLIFDCNMDAGHSGGSGRSTERKEIAKNYAYLLKEENLL
ncbi:oligopeptidase B [Lishizhenia tianjinensis]|uniref:Oligopeptidase B n=1 Tax=Lishizhenia tianjinensis TaxID=477690 RepID=A0A1I6Y7Y0_9FLAO|nr:S9 family peptidase [Lishizhenia tianjinensis]SFT46552.1 oligopeptidase B [Lishizhenia tianjinensis]